MFHKADLNKVPTGATSLSEDGRKENISSILQAALNLSHFKRSFGCSLAKGDCCAYLGLEKSAKPLQCIELCCIWRAVDKHTLLVRLRLLRRSWVPPLFGPVCFVLLHITDCTLHPGQPITRDSDQSIWVPQYYDQSFDINSTCETCYIWSSWNLAISRIINNPNNNCFESKRKKWDYFFKC